MLLFWIKVFLSGLIVAVASEVSKRSSFLGGVIVALPLVSILTISWLYFESKNLEKVSELSYSIFWFVIPSLGFFLFLSWMIKFGFGFLLSLAGACLGTAALFYGFSKTLTVFGIKF